MAQSTGEVERAEPTTDELRAQIEHTRTEMTETIDAIQARLSPGQLATDAKEAVKRAAVDPLTVAIVAATMAAVGIRWLRRPRDRSHRWKRAMAAGACVSFVCCSAAALRVQNQTTAYDE